MKVWLIKNDFFPERKTCYLELLKVAEKIGKRIAALKEAARQVGIPIIYINDNFGRWKSDFHHVIEYVIKENKPGITIRKIFSNSVSFSIGKPLAELLLPSDDDCILRKKTRNFLWFFSMIKFI